MMDGQTTAAYIQQLVIQKNDNQQYYEETHDMVALKAAGHCSTRSF